MQVLPANSLQGVLLTRTRYVLSGVTLQEGT